jgi:hypothetical protein
MKAIFDLMDAGWTISFWPDELDGRVMQVSRGDDIWYQPFLDRDFDLEAFAAWLRDEMKVVEHGDDLCRVRPVEEPRPRQGP